MFIGEYKHQVDAKGRIAIPSKFRKGLKYGVVTKGLDGCLIVYTATEWRVLAKRLSSLPVSKPETRAIARYMLAAAMDFTLDSQGRIMLPQYLRGYSSIQKQVIIAGLYNRIEIWDEIRWNTYKEKTEKETEFLAEQLGEF
jgi:MraZ protein